MPRFFFHSLDGYADRDTDGTELPSEDAARIQAVIYAGEILRFEPMRVWDGSALRVEVTSETADILFVVVTKMENH